MKTNQTRTDIQPVIIGGDISSYPLAREFHEAFGVTSICVVPEPLKIIEYSSFIEHYRTRDLKAQDILGALEDIASRDTHRHVILMANSDAAVAVLEEVKGLLPANVICPLPPHDVMERVSNKISFAELCREHGLGTPHSEVVHLAGDEPISPTNVPFPLIAKPAVSSAEYTSLYQRGFKKVYFIQGQAELDELWANLRAEGFVGDFLVQKLIMGDDSYVDMITAYVDQRGEVTMFASAQVLLEDHAPTLFGNPVGMICRPMPELWERVGGLLKDIGWRGFANFDMKRDPDTGEVLFMDFNPRIGCNSYYICAGGINPMEVLVSDLVDHKGGISRISRKAIYTRTPTSLLRSYLTDGTLTKEFDGLVRDGLVFNPMRYPGDGLKARLMGLLMTENFRRKFARYYPKVTDTAF
ncbi:carboxylate--amine ligase [Olsenella urininfantis]|uniref:carboxylate--amine ligase n=1 Tax=Olsenella urininfantis TaxID=1871033 RepID=UPI001F3C4D91|nr:ATP-grasp domain-containing protein [Olsenella urininfantis]